MAFDTNTKCHEETETMQENGRFSMLVYLMALFTLLFE